MRNYDAEKVVRDDLIKQISQSVDEYMIENGITITFDCWRCGALMQQDEYYTFGECQPCWNKFYPWAKREGRLILP